MEECDRSIKKKRGEKIVSDRERSTIEVNGVWFLGVTK